MQIQINEAIRLMKEYQTKTARLPVKFMVNEDWLNQQVKVMEIEIEKGSPNIYKTLYGIPFEIDNSISSIQFIYSDIDMLAIQREMEIEAIERIKKNHWSFGGDE